MFSVAVNGKPLVTDMATTKTSGLLLLTFNGGLVARLRTGSPMLKSNIILDTHLCPSSTYRVRGEPSQHRLSAGPKPGVVRSLTCLTVDYEGVRIGRREENPMLFDKFASVAAVIVFLASNPSPAVAQADPSLEAVKRVNHALYTAISARDVNALQQVWASGDPDIQSIGATSRAPLIGWDAIKKVPLASFDRFPEISVNMVEPIVRLHGQTAEIVGVERQILKQADDVILRITTLGTNVFEKQPDDTWLLVSRHSSIPR